MSWLRSTVYKAMEVRKKNKANVSRICSVVNVVLIHVGYIVAGDSNILQDHSGSQIIESFINVMKRLDEVSISCKGLERTMLLRRLLASLELIEGVLNDNKSSFEVNCETLNNEESHLVKYRDLNNLRDAHLNLRYVILQSHVVEGIVLSMIIDAPNEEEITLLLNIFRHSLIGERNIHDAIMINIQELTKVFSNYHDEVLSRREELLQYAQIAVSGLKVNVDRERIDMKVSTLEKRLYETKIKLCFTNDDDDDTNNVVTMEMYLKLEDLLLREKTIRDGDSIESRAQKVNKLKVLVESLTKSTFKAEKCILDHRSRIGEALQFCLVKSTKVTQLEKTLEEEIKTLGQKKDEFEVALQKVNDALIATKTRLRNVREEINQFEEGSIKYFQDLQLKEEDLLKSVTSSKSEAKVVTTWMKFIEDAWNMKTIVSHQIIRNTIDELKIYSQDHAKMIIGLLLTHKVGLENLVTRFRILARQLKPNETPTYTFHLDDENFLITLTRTNLEEDYLDLENKLNIAFDLVESMRKSYKQSEEFFRKDEKTIEDLFIIFEKMKLEFQSFERPSIKYQPQKQLIWQGNPFKLKTQDELNKDDFTQREYNKDTLIIDWNVLGLEDGTPHSESTKHSKSHFVQDITDWEFDAIGN